MIMIIVLSTWVDQLPGFN